MHHNNAFCLDLLYRKKVLERSAYQRFRVLLWQCSETSCPRTNVPRCCGTGGPGVRRLGWNDRQQHQWRTALPTGESRPTSPDTTNTSFLPPLTCSTLLCPARLSWSTDPHIPPLAAAKIASKWKQSASQARVAPASGFIGLTWFPWSCLTQIVAVGEVKPCELRQLPETDRVFGQFEKARVSSDWESFKMGEEEVATKKGRRMIACSGRFHQKLLEPFFIVCEHADQWSKRGTWLASFVEQFNIKLLVIWACIQRWLVITVKIGKNSLEDVMLVIYRICTADSAELVLVCVGWLYVMLLVKYLQYCLLLSVIELCGHGFWRRRGRGLLSVWFSSDRANGFTVAQARFTLKH